MIDLIKVKGNGDLARDRKSGALININRSVFDRAKTAKKNRKKKDQEIQDLKNEVGEIKDLLKQLLEKK